MQRRIKKVKKVIGGIAASIILTQPAIAQEVEKPKNNITPKTELVNSYRELKEEYKEMAAEAVSDKILLPEEIYTIKEFLEKNYEHLGKTASSQEQIVNTFIPTLDKVINEYPALLDNRVNIAYNPNTELSKEHTELLKSLIQNNPDEKIEKLAVKENLTLKDLIEICYAHNLIGGEILNSAQEISNKDYIEEHLHWYIIYVDTTTKLKKDEFYTDASKWHLGFLGMIKWDEKYKHNLFNSETKIAEGIKNSTQINNFEMKHFTDELPNKPSWFHFFAGMFAIFAPLGVRLGAKAYTGRDKWTTGQSVYHFADSGMGALGFEVFFPPLFYARLAIPLIHEIYRGYKPKDD